MNFYTSIAALIIAAGATIIIAACSSSTEIDDSSFLRASITGALDSEYEGNGTFRIHPAGQIRFTLSSGSAGGAITESFTFHAMRAPAPGEYAIGELDEHTVHANYWYEEGNVRKIFEGVTGALRIDNSTPSRVTGSFRLKADFLYECRLVPATPAPVVDCEPVQEAGAVEAVGSFDATPFQIDLRD